jgi:hypothetical protein
MYTIERPARHKREYHGNGKNAWYGSQKVVNGHLIERKSVRYSYRWHKTIVLFDGRQLRTAADYRRAEAAINEERP